MAENERTREARDNDDSAIIDAAGDLPTPSTSYTSGGDLASDVASRGEEEEVGDPDGRARPEKQDDIDNGDAFASSRARS